MGEIIGGLNKGQLSQSLTGIRSVQQQVADRQRQIDEVKSNSAQEGRVSAFYTATGTGSIVEPNCFSFGAVFTEKPLFTPGAEILGDADPVEPIVWSASVYRWRRNRSGFYTGAYVQFYVSSLSSGGGALTEFHLLWSGTVINDFISSLNFPVESLGN